MPSARLHLAGNIKQVCNSSAGLYCMDYELQLQIKNLSSLKNCRHCGEALTGAHAGKQSPADEQRIASGIATRCHLAGGVGNSIKSSGCGGSRLWGIFSKLHPPQGFLVHQADDFANAQRHFLQRFVVVYA